MKYIVRIVVSITNPGMRKANPMVAAIIIIGVTRLAPRVAAIYFKWLSVG